MCHRTKEQRIESLGMGLRSSQRQTVTLAYNDEHCLSEVTKIDNSSCYHWEDLLNMHNRNVLLIYSRNNNKRN